MSGQVILGDLYLRINAVANGLGRVLNFEVNNAGKIILTFVNLLIYAFLQLNLGILHKVIELV